MFVVPFEIINALKLARPPTAKTIANVIKNSIVLNM
jgi:hypothetical protein